MTRIFTRNLGWKLASLGTAAFLWVLYSGARELTTSVSSPVQYRNIPTDLEITSEFVEQAHLILRGPSTLLARVSGDSVPPVVIDLGELREPGQRTFTLDRRNVNLPSGVVLERAIPGQIRLRLERRMSAEALVHPRFENIPSGTQITSVDVKPAKLRIVGPESLVRAIERVETDSIDLGQLAGGGEVRTSAYSGNPHVSFMEPPTVTVRVRVSPLAGGPKKKN